MQFCTGDLLVLPPVSLRFGLKLGSNCPYLKILLLFAAESKPFCLWYCTVDECQGPGCRGAGWAARSEKKNMRNNPTKPCRRGFMDEGVTLSLGKRIWGKVVF